MTFTQLLWLVPILFAIHNLEEAPFMAAWTQKLPNSPIKPVTTPQFSIAVTILTILSFVITFWGIDGAPGSIELLLILAIQAIMLVNAIVPHIATTIKFKMYSPGVITAVFLNIPFSVYLFSRAINENFLITNQLIWLFVFAPFAMIALAGLSLKVGNWIFTLFQSKT